MAAIIPTAKKLAPARIMAAVSIAATLQLKP